MNLRNNFSCDLCPVGLQTKTVWQDGGQICCGSPLWLRQFRVLVQGCWRSFQVRAIQRATRMIPAGFDNLSPVVIHWHTGRSPYVRAVLFKYTIAFILIHMYLEKRRLTCMLN